MFAKRKKRRDLQQSITAQREKLSPLLHEIYSVRESSIDQSEKVEALGRQYSNTRAKCKDALRGLEQFESDLLTEKALRMGIELPQKEDWWLDNSEEVILMNLDSQFIDDFTVRWLTKTGRLMVAKLIKEERKRNIEWWVKIVTPVLVALISFLGLVVALITVSKK